MFDCVSLYNGHLFTYLVTLNIRNSRRALSTENPKEPPLKNDHMTSNMEPTMTTQSKRLNAESKYIRMPSAYILMNISAMKSTRKTYSE